MRRSIWINPKVFKADRQEHKVYNLKKSLYVLKQSFRQWYLQFDSVIGYFGFVMTKQDHCVYVKHFGNFFLILTLYIDDILMAGNDKEMIVTTKGWLTSNFEMKDIGEAGYILGVKIFRYRSKQSQEGYIHKILERFRMNEAKPIDTPLEKNHGLSID